MSAPDFPNIRARATSLAAEASRRISNPVEMSAAELGCWHEMHSLLARLSKYHTAEREMRRASQ